jgi:hypothetical protein
VDGVEVVSRTLRCEGGVNEFSERLKHKSLVKNTSKKKGKGQFYGSWFEIILERPDERLPTSVTNQNKLLFSCSLE